MPEVHGRDMDGNAVRVDDYRGQELMLLLLSPGCGPCEQVMRVLRRAQREIPRCPQALIVLEAEREEAQRALQRTGLRVSGVRERVILDAFGDIRKNLGIERTPYGFL